MGVSVRGAAVASTGAAVIVAVADVGFATVLRQSVAIEEAGPAIPSAAGTVGEVDFAAVGRIVVAIGIAGIA